MDSSKQYDGYEKLKTVGQGAFGTATLCKRIKDGEQVVMKEIFTMNMDNAEKKATLNEVEILSTLNHPNIIKYISSFRKEESLVIIMEYANGGNLAQLLNSKKNNNQLFSEKSILNILSQITAGISYIHLKKILHRDLKTANIFLNMNGAVKIGDFGISKMLNTRSQAQTVVGTPYYLSPEMCEGHDYNEKSDIWAIGCILYEMCCLRKPFEATTLPVLVRKITRCVYDDIPIFYSKELSELVKSILQKNVNLRPTAKYIYETIIPSILRKLQTSSMNFSAVDIDKIRDRSVLYILNDFINDLQITPIELPHGKIIDFCTSGTHQVAVTNDYKVYVWGGNQFSQLALGDDEPKLRPVYVNFLKDQKIIRCAAGKGFTIFLNDQGKLLSVGDGSKGCLGHGDWKSLKYPAFIESLRDNIITQIACGDEHVAALSSEGRTFTWGCSRFGQLGQGHTQNRCKPLAIILREYAKIVKIYCGNDATLLITSNGQIYVSGKNTYNKLGLLKYQQINLFTILPTIKEKMKFVSIGFQHTAMVTENGTIIFLGRNSEAQFGKGNFQDYSEPQVLKMKNKIITATCGSGYTLAIDSRNVLWFWGMHNKQLEDLLGKSNNHIKTDNFSSLKSLIHQENENNIIKNPTPIIALYASKQNIQKKNIIYFGQIYSNYENSFVVIHTTAPPCLKEFSGGSDSFDSGLEKELSTRVPSIVMDLPNTARH